MVELYAAMLSMLCNLMLQMKQKCQQSFETACGNKYEMVDCTDWADKDERLDDLVTCESV